MFIFASAILCSISLKTKYIPSKFGKTKGRVSHSLDPEKTLGYSVCHLVFVKTTSFGVGNVFIIQGTSIRGLMDIDFHAKSACTSV